MGRADIAVGEDVRGSSRSVERAVEPWPVPLLLVVGLAAVLCFYRIAAKSLWLDEATSVTVAQHDWPEMWQFIRLRSANMAAYFVALHYWLRLGTGEAAVRALSALAATASIVPLYGLGRRCFGPRPAVLAALLLAVNGFFIRYAQEARGYALVLLLVTTSSYLFVRVMERPTAPRLASYAVVGASAIYAHLFGALVIVAHGLTLLEQLLWRRRSVSSSRMIAAGLATCVLASPLLAYMRGQGALEWVTRPSIHDLVDLSLQLSGGGGRLLLLTYVAASCAGVVALAGLSRSGAEPDHRWRSAFLLQWLLVPVVASFLFSIYVKPVFVVRYLIVVLPPLALLAAIGLLGLKPAWLRVVSLVLLLALSARGLVGWYGGEHKENWRAAAGYVVANAQEGDGIVFEAPYVRIPFEYYLRRAGAGARAPAPVLPSASWGALPLLDPELDESARSWLRRNPPDRARLWLVLSHESIGRPTREPAAFLPEDFADDYCSTQQRSFWGIRVVLYQQRAVCNRAVVSDSEGRHARD